MAYRIVQLLPAAAGWRELRAWPDEKKVSDYATETSPVAFWALCEENGNQFVIGVTNEQFEPTGVFLPDGDGTKGSDHVAYLGPGETDDNHKGRLQLVLASAPKEKNS